MRPLCSTTLALALLTACGGPPPAAREPSTRPASADAQATAAEGSTLLESSCVAGAEERCDALDSDCDGLVDEGCAAAPEGPIVVAAAWNTAALVRLDVTGPSAPSAEGAPACDAPRRAYQTFTASEPGEYVVSLVREAGCGEAPGVASVSVSVGGRALGPFNHALPEPGARVEVARFRL